MLKNSQTQKVGNNSTSIQAGGDMYISHGVSYSEAKEIALDVFKTNFYQLSEEAMDIATRRAEEFTEKVIVKLLEEKSYTLDSIKDPDLQYTLYNAQVAYARSGDENLSDVLVDLLVERVNKADRSLQQIVLNEALLVVPKLTSNQLDILSLLFIFKNANNVNMTSLEFLKIYVNAFVTPLISNLSVDDYNFWHLEYAGCGKIESGVLFFQDIFINKYSILLSKGFTIEQFNENNNTQLNESEILLSCFHNKDRFQFNVLKRKELNHSDNLLQLFDSSLMNDKESEKFLKEFDPDLNKLIDLWNSSNMKHMSLTSVGIAIGLANIRMKTGRDLNLGIWIKE